MGILLNISRYQKQLPNLSAVSRLKSSKFKGKIITIVMISNRHIVTHQNKCRKLKVILMYQNKMPKYKVFSFKRKSYEEGEKKRNSK